MAGNASALDSSPSSLRNPISACVTTVTKPAEGDLLRLLRKTAFGPKAVFKFLKIVTRNDTQFYLCLQVKPRTYGQNYAMYPAQDWEII